MKKILDLIGKELKTAIEAAGYDTSYAKAVLSNRPDLCEYQCNGAMAAAKAYHKKPIDIAQDVVAKAADSPVFSEITAVMPGFINMKLRDAYPSLAALCEDLDADEAEIVARLAAAGFTYDAERNAFV